MPRNRALLQVLSGIGLAVMAGASPSLAQGWAEQRPAQFRYADQGQSNEVLRNNLGISAAAAAAQVAISSGAGGAGGAGGSLQNADQMNNAIITTPTVTNSGSGDVYLNITINADQTSGTTNQSSTNTSQAARNGGSILNK